MKKGGAGKVSNGGGNVGGVGGGAIRLRNHDKIIKTP